MLTKKLTLTFMSGGIHVTNFNNAVRITLLNFSRTRMQWKSEYRRGRYVKSPHKVFAASNLHRTEFLFHRHDWDELKAFLLDSGLVEQEFEIKKKGFRNAVKTDLKRVSDFDDRDYQSEIISYAIQPSIYSLTVPLQTGKGKTYTGLRVAQELNCLTGVVSRLKHIKQWRSDIKEMFGLTDNDVYMVQGKDRLIKLIKMAKDNKFPYKFVLFSNSTLQAYIKRCENGEWRDYGCKPQDLFQLLRIGFKIVDEAHECLHLNFKLAMYLHVKKVLYLSASILTGDSFIDKMSEIIFPLHLRHDKLSWDKYIDVYAIAYKHERTDMRYNHPGNPNYAHSALEQWYLKHPKSLERYFKMIGDLVYNHYVEEYKDGVRAIIFVSYVEMATALTKYLQSRFSEFSVGRYCATENDPEEHLYDFDIRVTTPESAGTGTDIKELILNICTVNIASIQRNVQVQGRTRKPTIYKEVTPRFLYLWATDIDKHVTNHEHRLTIFESKAKNIFTVLSDYVI